MGSSYAPPAPADAEVLRNIEVLAAFVAKNGLRFEQLARSRKAQDPKFAFLFGGRAGSEPAIANTFYNWKKLRLQRNIFSPDPSDDVQRKICMMVHDYDSVLPSPLPPPPPLPQPLPPPPPSLPPHMDSEAAEKRRPETVERKTHDSERKTHDSERKTYDSERKRHDTERNRHDSERNRYDSERNRHDSERKRPRTDSESFEKRRARTDYESAEKRRPRTDREAVENRRSRTDTEAFDKRRPDSVERNRLESTERRSEYLEKKRPETSEKNRPEAVETKRPEAVETNRPEAFEKKRSDQVEVKRPEAFEKKRSETFEAKRPEAFEKKRSETIEAKRQEAVEKKRPEADEREKLQDVEKNKVETSDRKKADSISADRAGRTEHPCDDSVKKSVFPPTHRSRDVLKPPASNDDQKKSLDGGSGIPPDDSAKRPENPLNGSRDAAKHQSSNGNEGRKPDSPNGGLPDFPSQSPPPEGKDDTKPVLPSDGEKKSDDYIAKSKIEKLDLKDSPGPAGNEVKGTGEMDQHVGDGSEKQTKEAYGLKLLKAALADYVKEVLKPAWKEGNISKDAFKAIVKKVVDKVSGSLQGHQIPKSQENVDQYMSQSQAKIAKLVHGYVDKFKKPA